MESFRHLFTPLTIGGMELKNRIVMLAMTTGYSETDETVGARFIDFYAERAKGGAGLIIIPFSPSPAGSPVEPGLYDDRFVPGVRELTSQIHAGGAKIAAQLITSYHVVLNGKLEVVAPSPVLNQMMRCIPRALTVAEIRHIVAEYGKAARRARQAGFDAVEFLVGGGYLLNRFLSPITNRREDEYGGSLENRMRILLEVLASIRKAVGDDFPVGCRLNLQEQMEGGHTIEESVIVARALEKAGVNLINSYVGWHESPVPSIQPFLPKGVFAHLTGRIKAAVGVPVIAANRINDPFIAEKILAGGMADLVGMGRALLADPELPRKTKEGRTDEIVPCLACSNCLSEVISCYKRWGEPITTLCTVNPAAGREAEVSLKAAEKPKKVVVAGAGPGGLEAALTAARRGHRVTLFEKGREPGGRLLIASIPPYKDEVRTLATSLAARARRAGVEMRFETELSRETMAEEKPDVLILATGASTLVPDIPGVGCQNVATADDVLTGKSSPAGRVVIVGGGMVGCETAEFLLERGKGVTEVTVLEMLDRMADNVSPTYRPFFLTRLKRAGIRMIPGAKVREITEKGVKVERAGAPDFIEADAVVLAVGYKSDPRIVDELKDGVPEFYAVGDCVKPGMIREAIEEGFSVGRKI